MPTPKTIKEFKEKIEIEKDLLSAMPRNTEKNKKIYTEKIDKLIKEYTNYQKKILENIKDKYDSEIDIENSKEIENLDIRIKTIQDNLYLLNEYKTSYEKMKLDKLVYMIRQYYKDNLENVNAQILECIMKFSKVGIKLSPDDFNYSSYVNQYMQVFFSELKKGDVNSLVVKQQFEELYWKCSDILIHIELNIRNIYFKNKQQIDKHLEKEKNNLLKKCDKQPEEIMNIYYDLKKRRDEFIAINKKYILNKFMSGEFKTKDFTDDKLKANYEKILSDKVIESIKENSKEVQDNIIKFLNSLYEYRNYLKFKFVIDDVKKHYHEKENYKRIYLDTKKRVDNEEKELNKIKKSISKRGLFKKRDNSNKLVLQNQKILEIEDLYKELDFNKFCNKIYTELTDTSSLYDVLKLAESYYVYMMKCIINNNKEITRDEANKEVEELHEFLENPNNTIIKNITILEDKDIAIIIKDRYKLLDFKVEKEDISVQNLDNLISILENIVNSLCFKIAGLDVEKVDTLLEYGKILK